MTVAVYSTASGCHHLCYKLQAVEDLSAKLLQTEASLEQACNHSQEVQGQMNAVQASHASVSD